MAAQAGTSKSYSPRVLILFYSLSKQTQELLNSLAAGLQEGGALLTIEKLEPVTPLAFPFLGVFATIKMMIATLFRSRVAIRELSAECGQDYDLTVLAGPTWSYNPSGPVLSLIDRDGKRLFGNRRVLAFISCRGYWRLHWYGLKRMLQGCGAEVVNLIVFSHPCNEPWRTLGVFLKIAGKEPEKLRLISRFYRKYGHSREQQNEARQFGRQICETMQSQAPLAGLNFQTPAALP